MESPSCNPVSYAAARRLIRNGDIALSRGSTIEGEIIERATGSPYSHATMLGWAKPDTLMIGETRQHRDGRLIDARSEIARWPGYYDVFRPWSPHYSGDAAWTFVCHAAGASYGWRHLITAWLRRRLAWLFPTAAAPNSDEPDVPRFCSQLVHAALRAGDGPQVTDLDCDVAPGDLADPGEFQFLFTLFATPDQVRAFKVNQVMDQ